KSDDVATRRLALGRGLQSERRDDQIAQFQQRVDPVRGARRHPDRGFASSEDVSLDDDAICVDELRAGQQPCRIDGGGDLLSGHAGTSLFANRWKRKMSSVA